MNFPTSLGRYRVESLIGKGGMGEVYKAFDPSLDRTVALKTIATGSDNREFLERLRREARACGRLQHPRIVTVYDLGEADNVVFIAMEYLQGENLSSALESGRLSVEQRLTVLIQVLDALEYAHSEGVIHRDIKPSNVHILTDGNAKLLDFGLARVERAEALTMSGSVMGTPYYMSPEQIKGVPVDGRTDVYSTGVVAYELFTRRRAFDAENISTIILKVLTEVPQPMATAFSLAFPELEAIVSRAIAKEPSDRYATAGEMRDALAAFLVSSRDAIAREQQAATIRVQRTVAEATGLIASGNLAASERLLTSALGDDPDADEVRALLGQVTTKSVSPQKASPTPRAPTSPQPAVAAGGRGKTVVSPTAPQPPSWSPRAATPPPPVYAAPAPQPGYDAPMGHGTRAAAPPPLPSPTPVRNGTRRLVAIGAAVLGVLIVAAAMSQMGQAPAGGTNTTAQAGSLGESQIVSGTSNSGQGTSASTPIRPTTNNANATSTTVPPIAERPAQSASGAASSRSSVAAATTDPRAVYIDTTGTDASLRRELDAALRAQGLMVVASAAAARFEISATTQVSVRQSPFAGNSALTADYVGTLTIRNRATGERPSVPPFDGHALEFGEPVVREAALRGAAAQMAEFIKTAVGN